LDDYKRFRAGMIAALRKHQRATLHKHEVPHTAGLNCLLATCQMAQPHLPLGQGHLPGQVQSCRRINLCRGQ
jgi:hypothetical protein